jgi:hypothetical protein
VAVSGEEEKQRWEVKIKDLEVATEEVIHLRRG